MKYTVYFKYEIPVDFEAENDEEAKRAAADLEPDWNDAIYCEDYDIEAKDGNGDFIREVE